MVYDNYTEGGNLNRRTALKAIATTGVAAGGLTVGSGAVAGKPKSDCDFVVDDTGKADYRSIQAAENAAQPGATICVEPGTYEESVMVDTENLTIQSTANRHAVDVIGQGGTRSSAISIATNGVTLDGLSVHNPDRLIGVKVERGVSGATVSSNLVSDVGPTGRLGVTGIVAGGNNEDLVFSNNIVEDLRQAGEGPFNPSTNGIFLDNNGGGSTSVEITGNEVEDLSSEYASIGILTQDATEVNIEGNSVRDVSADDPDGFDFATGINVDGGSDVTVSENDVRDVISDEGLGAAFVADGAVDPATLAVEFNNLVSRIGFGNNTVSSLDATCNYWDHPSGPEDEDNPDGKGSLVVENPGQVDFTPWSRKRVNGQKQRNSCTGGTDQRGNRGQSRGQGNGRGQSRGKGRGRR